MASPPWGLAVKVTPEELLAEVERREREERELVENILEGNKRALDELMAHLERERAEEPEQVRRLLEDIERRDAEILAELLADMERERKG